MFVDLNSPDEILTDTELLPIIRRTICDKLIAPMAVQTSGTSSIMPLLAAAPFFVNVKKIKHRLNKANLTTAIIDVINTRKSSVEIMIATSHFFVDETSGPVTYLNWEKFSTTAVTAPVPPQVLSAADIAVAVASAIPAPPTATDLANAFAAAYSTANTPTNIPNITTSGNISGNPVATQIFNTRNLPANVRTRLENRQKGGLILGSTVRTPFSNGHFYHIEGFDKFILSDGTLFIKVENPNEKALFKAMVSCDDDTHAGIHSWYQKFTQACYDYGFYCHPIYCFRSDHGGKRGFTIGDDPSNDLPITMNMPIASMAGPLHCLLLKRNMFPPGSRLISIVNSAENDGYVALKAILFASHPAFCPQPSTLITSYPKQRDRSTLEFYKLFIDYLQLRAYICNIDSSLDNESELDIFINNCKHGQYLNRVTRDERRISSLKHKYTGQQLVETLDKYLMAPDSPT